MRYSYGGLPRIQTVPWRLKKARILGVGIFLAAGPPVVMVLWMATDGELEVLVADRIDVRIVWLQREYAFG